MTEKLTLREQIDPDGLLPEVKLVASTRPITNRTTGIIHQMFQIHRQGESVGSIKLARNPNSRETWTAMASVVTAKVGQGLGTSAYLLAIEKAQERGDIFRTDTATKSESAKGVWRRFIQAGVAHVVEPFVPLEPQPDNAHQTLYNGRVEIPMPTSTDSVQFRDEVDRPDDFSSLEDLA